MSELTWKKYPPDEYAIIVGRFEPDGETEVGVYNPSEGIYRFSDGNYAAFDTPDEWQYADTVVKLLIRENADLRQRNDLFTRCMRSAQKIFLDAHPGHDGFPDGAENIAWILEQLDAANADAERLAKDHIVYGESWQCPYCGKWGNVFRGIQHAADCPVALHRARVGGSAKKCTY